MRTTLSLDDDVAAMLERLRKRQEVSLKQVVNEALRRGLSQQLQKNAPTKPFTTHTVDLGRCRLPSLDNVAEVLAVAEGESFK